MGAVRKLTENDLKRVVGISGKQYKTVQWHTSELVIKQILTVEEYMATVNNILHDCKAPNSDDVAVELIDFAIKANIISAYSFVELPKDINSMYYIVYASDLYETVLSQANKKQIESIIDSVMLYLK